jgi:hypothetical protein
MDEQSQQSRLSLRGHEQKLTVEQEQQLIDEAKNLRSLPRPEAVSIDWTVNKVEEITGGAWKPSNGWGSKFWVRQGWPNRATQARNLKECRATLAQEAADFQEEMRIYALNNHIPKDGIWAMDETGVWTGGVPPRTFVDPATMDSSVIQDGDHQRDSVAMALSVTGESHFDFIEHKAQRSSVRQGVRTIVERGFVGMGTAQMEAFTDSFNNDAPTAKLLIMDGLSAHKNKGVAKKFDDAGVGHKIMPPQTAKLISPLDNPYFATFKAKLRKENISTASKKKAAVIRVTNQLQGNFVASCWEHSGWRFQ